jgi:hypothetical protein
VIYGIRDVSDALRMVKVKLWERVDERWSGSLRIASVETLLLLPSGVVQVTAILTGLLFFVFTWTEIRSRMSACFSLTLVEWQEEWPDSLKAFVQTACQLSLSRGQVARSSDLVLYSTPLPLGQEISFNIICIHLSTSLAFLASVMKLWLD